MALTIDPATKEVTVPQSDLTLVTGTLYEMDTEQFMRDLNALLDDADYIWMDDAFSHNTEVTIVGATYARFIEMINSWNITFSPDSAWSVRLAGSNNNLFDVENGILNQNNVQVIAQNSAGLIVTGSALTGSDLDDIADAVWDEAVTDHTSTGSFGEKVGKFLLTVGKFLGLK